MAIAQDVLASRRELLRAAACGFGYTALAALLNETTSAAAPADSPLAPRKPHYTPRAKRVIFLFMQGGPSQMETFDYKPRLDADHGKPAPFQRDGSVEQPGVGKMRLFGSSWKFAQRGQAGTWVSELFPHIGSVIDEVAVLNGMHTDSLAHAPATMQVHTGATNFVRPSTGAWVIYGLGTENQNLPGFITINPLLTGDGGSPQHFGSAFLPAIYQGTAVNLPKQTGAAADIRYLRDKSFPLDRQRRQLDFLQKLNRRHIAATAADAQLEGMIESFELAFRMQTAAPSLLEFGGESKATQEMYGIGDGATDAFGRQCLLARRLAETGVRFVQVNSPGWDHHTSIRSNLPRNAASVDKPIAGLIRDLKSRGLLDDTLVVWTGEFGRTPYEQDLSNGKSAADTYGRGHNPYGFTSLLAGGGVRGGVVHGATDEYGYRAVEGKVHIHDLHATMLHLLGLDHERLTYRFGGRDFRLTDIHGRVVTEVAGTPAA
ncbi:MAG: DUF1501 domain-containing protein [Pirellulaceae bacterium]|jgi:hypothetical protein|nr:DUF1501 domain-containing protein [Pirellulaceae bacterium]MDP7014547.1 DUF1501 domain-containing protein [Pirellulaceae bacterium]